MPLFKKLHDFHIALNTSCLLPKFGVSIVFHFSWDDFQEKLETMAMQNLGVGGGGGVKRGVQCGNGEAGMVHGTVSCSKVG